MKRLNITRYFALSMILYIYAVSPAVCDIGGKPINSCIGCHGNVEKMKLSGYPHFTLTQKEAEDQSGMPATCADCHLGDPNSPDKDGAHKGMGRLGLVEKKGLKGVTAERKLPLEIGKGIIPSIRYQLEKSGKNVVDPSVNTILYQDKRSDTLSQDFPFMEKTCGKCHAKEVEEFRKSNMGRNAKQSVYKSWSGREHGPHNCGVWFGDNCKTIADETSLPFDKDTCSLNQRSCNTCHVGCLDCHYLPSNNDEANRKKGMHSFNRRPEPASCYGGGRGTFCHMGPEERRRGAGYFGGKFSFPEGAEPDIHLKAGVGCLDCHENSGSNRTLGHGTIKRQATCEKCHDKIVKSHAASVHNSLSCEACHITDAGGYQATFWGPGKLAGFDTPYYKFNGYYGIMKDPILIRDQRGRWIPVKPYPMAVMNQKGADLKPGLHWRYPKNLPDLERTDDAWGYAGLFGGLPENNKALLWIQMDKLSHKYGKGRSCESCHGSVKGEQSQTVEWEYSNQGAFPFKGSHRVVADRKGLSIQHIKADEEIDVSNGYRLCSFAPWFYLKDKWRIDGNFALPPIMDMKRYERERSDRARTIKDGIVHAR